MGDEVATGVIRTSHGKEGYVKVRSFSGETEYFTKLKEVTLVRGSQRKRVRVEHVRAAGGDLLVKFEGIDSAEEGKMLASWEIWIERSKAAPRAKGEYYVADLVGCDMIFDNRVTGTVESVCELASEVLLEVRIGEATGFIPFRDQFIGDVDVASRTVQLRDPSILE